MNLTEMMYQRRSVRSYTGEKIPEELLNKVLAAGLLAESGRNIRPWEFIVVNDKELLKQMADCRIGSVSMLKSCDCAIAVVGDETKTDVWTEDCSIAMAHMHLMADSLGLGSCWIQGRLREAANGQTTEHYLRTLLHFPEKYRLEAILSLGMPEQKPDAHSEKDLDFSKVHYNRF